MAGDNELGKPHIDKALVAAAPTATYRWHKFWTRKPHNVVGAYIDHYSNPGEVVLDPFSGSGVTAVEAVKRDRLAIAIDIVPTAIEILAATLDPVDIDLLDKAFATVERGVWEEVASLYRTICRKCKRHVQLACVIWVGEEPAEIRYRCGECGDIQAAGCPLSEADRKLVEQIERQRITHWYPTDHLTYPNGTPFMKGEGHRSIDELFTKRNLRALATIFDAVDGIKNPTARRFLRMAFSSMIHLASKLCPVRDVRPFAAFWAQHSYWVPPDGYMEMNVWELFESAYRGRQGIRKAKLETNQEIPDVKRARRFQDIGKDSRKYFAVCEPALLALKRMLPDSVDYVFTDPPYGGSIQFGELSYIWVSWLHKEAYQSDYLSTLVDHEVILSQEQDKGFDQYYSLLYATFQEIYRVLKPGRYMTVTFHNPRIKIRNATIRAATFSGFDYEKIVYQPPAISSYKSLLQPFGSADGDFFFRFHKPSSTSTASFQEADWQAFDRVVVETTKQVLAERGEPTPYTHIINYVDPVLARHGYFLSLNPDIEIDDILRAHSAPGKEFRLVEWKMGKVSGQSWWFQDMDVVYRLRHVPLSERVEGTVLRLLQRKHTVRFTEALNAVFTEFPNALTPDSSDVKAVLEQYAEPTRSGLWRLSKTVDEEQTAHSEMIYLLARLGRRLRYEVWVGRREQTESWMITRLGSLNTKPRPRFEGLSPDQQANIKNVDVVWHRAGKVRVVFEVENTTMLTEALFRAGGLPYSVTRFMVVPTSRNNLVHRKMSSPLFREMFERDSWLLLYYEDVRELCGERKGVTLGALKDRSGLKPLEDRRSGGKKVRRRARAPQLPFESL